MAHQGIWRTGLLAVALTFVFVMFVSRVDEWTKGLGSDFVALGQTGGTGTGTGVTGGGATFTVNRIIPQIAVGSFDGNLTKYITIMQIVNTGSTAITIKGNFYKQQDGSASDTPYTTNLTGGTITDGILPETNLAANGILVITGEPTTPGVYKGNWGKIQATGNISIASFFEIRDVVTNVLYSRVGVAGSRSMSKFVIPRVRNVATGLDVAFAIANAGSTATTVTATLRDAGGNLIATKTLNLAAGAQIARFVSELFGLTSEASGTSYSFVTFDGGTSAELGAVALSYEGINQTSFPVEQIQ